MIHGTTAPLIIVEGPDGAGKSTFVKAWTTRLCMGQAIHFGPLPNVNRSLGRIYVEAMLPALMGLHHLTLDRSWLSEVPYGFTFRGGKDRLGDIQRRMLERVAMRSYGIVISCDPGWETVENNYLTRGDKVEMAKGVDQLRQVYGLYRTEQTSLPVIKYNYLEHDVDYVLEEMRRHRCGEHLSTSRTAGNPNAKVLLVGESFAQHKEHDAFYQLPFVSFDRGSSSHWLTQQLEDGGINEDQLMWINADDPFLPKVLEQWQPTDYTKMIYALGVKAGIRLAELNVRHATYDHPQYWKRFQHGKPYPLIDAIKGALT